MRAGPAGGEPVSKKRYLIAEYCQGPFYTGWWLYERETNDGRPNSGYDSWGWLKSTDAWSPQQKLRDLCVWMGHSPPAVAGYSDEFAEWFAGQFPNGLQVRVSESMDEDHYALVEILATRPRQRRGVIRTLRGAARAERRRAEIEDAN